MSLCRCVFAIARVEHARAGCIDAGGVGTTGRVAAATRHAAAAAARRGVSGHVATSSTLRERLARDVARPSIGITMGHRRVSTQPGPRRRGDTTSSGCSF